ncbi:hypothetical protein Lalb_Chr02g0140791 [Lupinus albus]|uniref:Uncharacterized protein n=1 Tax=Lupinus albus TaxID=3870 RepID=A0A6A4QTV0_LUPAL|nr:hypothetical protein Lalb_Chr02g0140791 [Lupinus albus]
MKSTIHSVFKVLLGKRSSVPNPVLNHVPSSSHFRELGQTLGQQILIRSPRPRTGHHVWNL